MLCVTTKYLFPTFEHFTRTDTVLSPSFAAISFPCISPYPDRPAFTRPVRKWFNPETETT